MEDRHATALEALGYRYRRDSQGQQYWHEERDVLIHLVEHDSGQWEDLTLTRDFLRAHPGEHHDRPAGELAALARTWHVQRTAFGPVDFIAEELRDSPYFWAVTSGWALDLHLGLPLRPHRDVDVTVPRQEQLALRDHLTERGWRLDVTRGGKYSPWTEGEYLEMPVHQVHARRDGTFIDLLLSGVKNDIWSFRRAPFLMCPVPTAFCTSPSGIRYLAPELVLLFKSAHAGGDSRSKDAADFERILPHLTSRARGWLRNALEAYQPGHAWLVRL